MNDDNEDEQEISNVSENPVENQEPPNIAPQIKDELLKISTLNKEELKKHCGTLQKAEEWLEKCCGYVKDDKSSFTLDEGFALGGLWEKLKSVVTDLKETEVQRKKKKTFDYPSLELATSAFEDEFIETDDVTAFIDHLEEQRKEYLKNTAKKAPYFPVIQSSGYGKSKLMIGLMEGPKNPRETTLKDGVDNLDEKSLQDGPAKKKLTEISENYAIIYWCFASEGAFPQENVTMDTRTFRQHNRNVLEAAFKSAITSSIVDSITSDAHAQCKYRVDAVSDLPENLIEDLAKRLESFPKKVIFVVDEAINLLKDTTRGVSFFECLRSAMIDFKPCARKLFFVVLSTSPTLSEISPGSSKVPPDKLTRLDRNDLQGPMEPFLMFASFDLNKKPSDILATTIEDCHDPSFLYSLGRPLWYAFLKNGLIPSSLLDFALRKLLLCGWGGTAVSELTKAQLLALLGARFGIPISSISTYAPTLVTGHLARLEAISDDCKSVIISYPSEPILALASRDYQKTYEGAGSCLLAALREFLMNGVITKGRRGEMMVRFLNLCAIDKAMYKAIPTLSYFNKAVQEIKLMEFLELFSRKNAELSTKNLFKDFVSDRMFQEIEESRVCFTHFIYLANSREARITQNLLRYAYRRTAALVMQEGRDGIDWIIPLRLGGTTEKEEFIGLVGQDKDGVADTLQQLTNADNPVTHEDLNPWWFLDKEELATFPVRWQNVQWPSILFAVDIKEPGVALADARKGSISQTTSGGTERKLPTRAGTTKSDDDTQQNMTATGIPCIVLTGLDYEFLDDEERDQMNQFRDCRNGISDWSVRYTPLTFDD